MDLEAFKASLSVNAPANGLSRPLQAMWHQAKGDWDTAHRLAQSQKGGDGAWVHAFLHRVEGGNSNAAYWYRRAGKPVSSAPLDEEWEEIVAALIQD